MGLTVPVQSIRRRLLAWYDREHRNLPWRGTRDPYRIWLSEMMLQQTQVATVIPYYRRFLKSFPTVHHLARASQHEVMKHWAGLGYYARARNLHCAAKIVVSRFEGKFPDRVESLLMLPGIGRYSAGAIASIAFGRRAPVVDGNVARVIARLFAIQRDVSGPDRERIWQITEQLVPARRSGDFNQALMELGATTCLPGAGARCSSCPLQSRCRACKSGIVSRLPVRKRAISIRAETHIVAAIHANSRWLFVERPRQGLWGGLWELPTTVLNGDAPARAAQSLARKWACVPCRASPKPFCSIDRALTHRRIRFVGYRCRPRVDAKRRAAAGQKWLRLDEAGSLGLSTAMRQIVSALAGGQPRASSRSDAMV